MRRHRYVSLAVLFFAAVSSCAQVPGLLNYQGRVAVGGVNFNGTGQFKFALVNAAGTQTYWSNDGTSATGAEPTAAVTLPVANGLYAVLLGDASGYDNMTAIPSGAFEKGDVRLRVWFDDGTNGSQQLTPDQRIAAVGYAMMADNVTDGSITSAKLAAGAVTATNIAAGSITGTQLAAGAVQSTNIASGAAVANLAASGQAGVASGGLILSATDNPALVAAGYVKVGPTTTADAWKGVAAASAAVPSPRAYHTAVWTGSEMIIWGGMGDSGYLNDGSRYNPATDVWTPLPTESSPSARRGHTAVWTGREMVIWGGRDQAGTTFNTGARYRPSTNLWSVMSTDGAPAARSFHAAVWAGKVMFVWSRGTGGWYNPETDIWVKPISPTGAPPVIISSTSSVDIAVHWTGQEMIVWQGRCLDTFTAELLGPFGGCYDPSTDTWRTMNLTNAPNCLSAGRSETVWTGTEMLVWSSTQVGVAGQPTVCGGRYDPAVDAWNPILDMGGPAKPPAGTSCVWTGSEMIIWGGAPSGVRTNQGYRYNPTTRTWSTTRSDGAPPAREYHSAVWTGAEMIVFGGASSDDYSNETWRFTPGKTLMLYQKP